MTAVGRSNPLDPRLLALPCIAADPLVLRDVEASLLGLLADGHVLGGPVTTGEAGMRATLVDVDPLAIGILIRDQEYTPVAALTEVIPEGDKALLGRLLALRRRESGPRAELALDRSELSVEAPTSESTALVVLDRPPTTSDDAAVTQAAAAGVDTLWVILSNAPTGEVPLQVLSATAEAWLSELGDVASPEEPGAYTHPSGMTVKLRTAPLGWRDPSSDSVLVERLRVALGADQLRWLRAHDESAGSRLWQAILSRLHDGQSHELEGVTEGVARILLRWRPVRPRRGVTVMFSGLSGSGKSTVARGLADWLQAHTDRSVTLLDGDVMRQQLSSGLGFDKAGRVANVRRIGYVAAEVTRHGGVAICAPIAPYAETRAEVRAMVECVGDFLLVHVNTPIEECERRDLKGLYAKARAGTLAEFTGISDPYENPVDAVARIDTSVMDNKDAVRSVVEILDNGGWLQGREL